MVIRQLAVFDTYITSVLDNDFICDSVSKLYTAARVSRLGDAQLSLSILCCYSAVIIIRYFCVLRVLTCCCYSIIDLACVDIFLQNCVCCCRCRCLARCNRCLVKLTKDYAFKLICECQVADCDVARILYCDLVGHSIADCYITVLTALDDLDR